MAISTRVFNRVNSTPPYWSYLACLFLASVTASAGPTVPDAPGAENPPIAKDRYISFVPGNAGRTVALRVRLTHLDFPGGYDGEVRWVGPPVVYSDTPSSLGPFTASKLQCSPHYQDWGSISLIHVTGSDSSGEVNPSSNYAVQAIDEFADIDDPGNYSTALTVLTSGFCDTVGRWDGTKWSPPDGLVTYLDLRAGMSAFFGKPISVGRVRAATRTANPANPPNFSSMDAHPGAFAGGGLSAYGNNFPDCGFTAVPSCGNGTLEPGEQCDDSNTISGDGCSALCLNEPECGNGRLDPGEACDDGNASAGDGCDASCALESVCGNGLMEVDEECDDGNTSGGDGCDAQCHAEQRSAILSLVAAGSDGPFNLSGETLIVKRTGQQVRLDARLRSWDFPGPPVTRLDAFQVQIDAATIRQNSSGALRVPADVPCCCSGPGACSACVDALGPGSKCTPGGPICPGSHCTTIYLDGNRTDGFPPFSVNFAYPDERAATRRFFGTGTGGPHDDDGLAHYLATFVYDIPEDASGTYDVGFDLRFNRTGLVDENDVPIPLAEVHSAKLRVPESNRYLPFRVYAAGSVVPVAVRVKIVSLPLFPTFVGDVRWAGAPGTYNDSIPGRTFHAAKLQCGPLVRDWTAEPVIQLYGSEVVPGATYEIRTADAACVALGQESCMSPAVIVRTAPEWSDVVHPLDGASQPNFQDISAILAAFQSSPSGITKVQAQLQPRIPNPAINVGFADISAAVRAFQGQPYPFAAPDVCP